VSHQCDGIDLNLGCPQEVARRGGYGAFLMDQQHWPLLHDMVSTLHRHCRVPVTCKVRLFDDLETSLKYYEMLQSAGASLLTIHGMYL
jgi:tRNA-dihydrouridine synthase 1